MSGVAKRVSRLQTLLKSENLDAIIARSTTDLQWLTGFDGIFDSEQAHTAVVTADRCVIHTDSRYSTAMKACAEQEGLWEVDDVCVKDGRPVGVGGFVAGVLNSQGTSKGRIAIDAATPLNLYRSLCAALPEAELVEREADILRLRAVKEPEEIERMKAAMQIAHDAFLATLEMVAPGRTEAEISLKLEMEMRSRGAEELAFANIVASGPNSANPHAVPGQRVLQKGDLVVFDFGARKSGYRSDTTRTISIGAPTEQQRRIYDAVRLANETVQAAIKPGVSGKAMHELAEQVLADAGFGGRMGHGLGHGVGLDIHELPNLSPRNDLPLPPGAVVTVEPGVYIPGQDGVRIEDFGQVTCEGYENFCSLSHDMVVIE